MFWMADIVDPLKMSLSKTQMETRVAKVMTEYHQTLSEIFGVPQGAIGDIWKVYQDSLLQEITKEQTLQKVRNLVLSQKTEEDFPAPETKDEHEMKIDILPPSPPKKKVTESDIQWEAERVRCQEVNRACSSGRVIVGDPYFDASNPHWRQQAQWNLMGEMEESPFTLSEPFVDNPRFVTRQEETTPIDTYLASLP